MTNTYYRLVMTHWAKRSTWNLSALKAQSHFRFLLDIWCNILLTKQRLKFVESWDGFRGDRNRSLSLCSKTLSFKINCKLLVTHLSGLSRSTTKYSYECWIIPTLEVILVKFLTMQSYTFVKNFRIRSLVIKLFRCKYIERILICGW